MPFTIEQCDRYLPRYCTDQTSTHLCTLVQIYFHSLCVVRAIWLLPTVRKTMLLGTNLVCDSSCVQKWNEQCVLRLVCTKQRESRAARTEVGGLRREEGVSIKCGRHRRGCFLLVKVYRKSGDGAALSPVAPHHKSHFPLFKPWKFALVNLPRSAIGNFELHAFISQPALVKCRFFFFLFLLDCGFAFRQVLEYNAYRSAYFSHLGLCWWIG